MGAITNAVKNNMPGRKNFNGTDIELR
jgi:hypothetical protein